MPNRIHDRQTDIVRLIQAAHAPRCQHIKINGLRCQSPAMKKRRYCYYHEQQRRIPAGPLSLPLLEDANAVQMAIQQVIQAVALGTLDSKRAGLLLYALQTAAINLPNTDFEPEEEDQIVLSADLSTLCEEEEDIDDGETEDDDPETEETEEEEESEDAIRRPVHARSATERQALIRAALALRPAPTAPDASQPITPDQIDGLLHRALAIARR